MTVINDHEHAIRSAFDDMHDAIVAKDPDALRGLHDPEFQATELHGRLMTADEHIEAILEAGDLQLAFSGITVQQLTPQLALAWGRQTLRGDLRPEDMGPSISSAVADGITFVFTVVWRFSTGRWRMLTYHVSQVPSDSI